MPGPPCRNCDSELAGTREALRAIRAGGVDAVVIDSGSGEEVFTFSATADEPVASEVIRELAPAACSSAAGAS